MGDGQTFSSPPEPERQDPAEPKQVETEVETAPQPAPSPEVHEDNHDSES